MADDQQRARTILDYIIREYADALQGMPIDADTPLISSGLIDSLSMVSLKMFLDQTYHLRIPDAEASAEAFDSVAAIVQLLRRLGA
jgi:D-alanine--poly(phosphoribitol) ligase subunit 2